MPEATLDRRTVVLGAAWAVPVIAAAIATPLAAASGEPVCDRYHKYNASGQDVADIEITNTAVIVTYRKTTDIQDINVHKPSGNRNIHVDGKVMVKTQVIIPLEGCEDPSFVQVHGNNVHYYGGGVFR